jgi:hypothetical protein
MGGTMSIEAAMQSVDTAARLQEGVRSGLPVLIPGAHEPRAAPAEPIDVIADPAAASARAAAVFERIRRERDRVGDAAGHGRTRTLLARLWRRVYRGPDAAPVAVK